MRPRWTEAEESTLRRLFFEYDAEEIASALPGRTPKSVHHHAKALGLRKTPQQRGAIVSSRRDRELEDRLGEPICDWLRRRYAEEATYRELTAEVGINTRPLMRLMKKCGVEPISRSEAAKRLIRDRPEIIENLKRAAQTPEARCKLAQTRHKKWRARQSDQERDFLNALRDAGLSPSPEFPVARYNIDFAFPSVKLAVELDPLWHHSGRKARSNVKKDAVLESLGWTVLRLESRCATSFNVSKIESALRELASRQPSEVRMR